jgi:hypothetical protein
MSVPGDGHVKRDQPIISRLSPASTGQLHGPDGSEMSDRKSRDCPFPWADVAKCRESRCIYCSA